MAESLLIAGGAADIHLRWLVDAAAAQGLPFRPILVDPDRPPRLSWTVGGTLIIDGEPIAGKAMFCRYDVFSTIDRPDPAVGAAMAAWYAALMGYGLAANLRMLNAEIDPITSSKPAMLVLAAQSGLPVPPTTLSNDVVELTAAGDHIAKPVAGGSYAMRLDEAIATSDIRDGVLPAPAIVQPRLAYPERRVFRVGRKIFVFDIRATTLDSRLDPAGEIRQLPVDTLPRPIIDGVMALTDRVRCDFCAIDLKSDPKTGDLLFLELNNGPMFAGYDRASGGDMAREMLRVLIAPG